MCKVKERIYVCHTYYHVYVAFLKEFALPRQMWGQATLILSTMSTDFENLKERIQKTAFFEKVITFEEKSFTYFPVLLDLKKDRGNIVFNMAARIKFTKLYAKLEAPFVPVDFKQYREIYVFCDSDPIGYYLNANKIYYHALEDGIDCLKIYDTARYDNRGCFKLKTWLSKWNLIFIQNGYGKYCIDMEINNRACLKYDAPHYIEVPRKPLEDALGKEEKDIMIKAFVEDAESLLAQIGHSDMGTKNVIILTEPLCSLEVRKQIFEDILLEYCEGYRVFFKPHPRDLLDYEQHFPEHVIIKGKFPLEVMNLLPDVHFERAVSVFTQSIQVMDFVEEKIFLGEDFMDKYEEPDVHRYNDKI